ncbi:MAG: hypothetical protein J2P48_12725 [Alphaproteobacteria bacterium]|nr:hypothetical protein [Alphaproteobacteria bacterium]
MNKISRLTSERLAAPTGELLIADAKFSLPTLSTGPGFYMQDVRIGGLAHGPVVRGRRHWSRGKRH